MCINIVYGAVLLHQLRCCLFSNLWYARDIVGCITHQCFQLNKLDRRYLIMCQHVRLVIIFYLRLSRFGLGYSDFDML